MFEQMYATDSRLEALAQHRRLIDNIQSRSFAHAKTELPSHAIGFPSFLLNHVHRKKTGNLEKVIDRKRYAKVNDEESNNWNPSLTTWKSMSKLETLGPSSLQIFAGEDPMKTTREEIMKNNQKKWLEFQIAEKALRDVKQRHHQLIVEKNLSHHSKIMSNREKQIQQSVKDFNKAIEKYNKQLSLHKLALKDSRDYQEESTNNKEKMNLIKSNILSKDIKGSSNCHIFIPKKWDEIEYNSGTKIHKQEADQVFQQKAFLQEKEQQYWNERNSAQNRSNLIEERQRARWSKEQQKYLMKENMRLSEEKQMLKSKPYKFLTEDNFYDQFEKTYR